MDGIGEGGCEGRCGDGARGEGQGGTQTGEDGGYSAWGETGGDVAEPAARIARWRQGMHQPSEAKMGAGKLANES